MLWFQGEYKVPVVLFHFLVGFALSMHVQHAHPGRLKLSEMLKRLVWHPSLDSITRDVCFGCLQCQLSEVTPQEVYPPTLKIQATFPMEIESADLLEFP